MKRGIWIVLLLLTVTTVSAQDTGWTLISANTLDQFAGADYSYDNPILSPDGSQVAWTEGQGTCVYTFDTNTTTCTAWASDMRVAPTHYNLPAWSPDGSRIVYHENFFLNFIDSDLWTFDVDTQQTLDWTNDFYLGSVINDRFTNQPIDYLPTWNPATGEVFFLRSERIEDAADDEPGWSLGLYHMVGNRPDLLHDLTDQLPLLSVYRPMRFSPDGTTLALIVLPPNPQDDPASGVWLLDVETGALEQVTGLSDLQAGMPVWMAPPPFPDMVAWAEGGLVVQTIDRGNSFTHAVQNSFYVELPSGMVTPLVDFSGFATPEDYAAAREAGPSAATDTHVAGAVSPDGGTYWYLGRTMPSQTTTLYEVSLPPAGEAPQPLGRIAFRPGSRQQTIPTVSPDGRVLFYNFLFTFEQN